MIKAAIEKILSLSAPNIIKSEGREYSDKSLSLISPPHTVSLHFRTLKGLADVIKNEIADFGPLTLIVGEKEVSVCTDISAVDMKRDFPYAVEADVPTMEFGRYMSYESMMIALKSKFLPTDELNELVKLLGTITEENRTAISDDGFTQTVNVKQGIALVGNKAVNPIVKLRPFRTFIEVEQPESEFLVRLRSGGEVALFEADGGAWKLEARHNTAEFLRKELVEIDSVLIVE